MTKTFEELEAKVDALAEQIGNDAGLRARIQALENAQPRMIEINRVDEVAGNLRIEQRETARELALTIDAVTQHSLRLGWSADRLENLRSRVSEVEIRIAELQKDITSSTPEVLSGLLQGIVGETQILAEKASVDIQPNLTAALGEMTDGLDKRLKSLEVLLLGDTELRAKWEKGKPNYPNIPEPPPGLIEQFQNGHDSLTQRLSTLLGEIDKRFTFVRKLQGFFGELLENRNPPFDGAQIATEAYVDRALERLSGALRREFTNAVAEVTKMANFAHEFAEAFYEKVVDLEITDREMRTDLVFAHWVQQLLNVIAGHNRRTAAEEAAKNRPTRLSMLRAIISGQPPTNGERR